LILVFLGVNHLSGEVALNPFIRNPASLENNTSIKIYN